MPSRRGSASAKVTWTPPNDAQLRVLERQLRDGTAEAPTIKSRPYGNDGWSPWITNLRGLIEKSLGPESPQASAFHHAGGMFADGPDRRDFHSQPEYDAAMARWRNEKIDRYVEAADGALQAISQELEVRGATPPATVLPARSFAFVIDKDLRAIATRDYGELKDAASGTVKAAALLAGSVIEAILYDTLLQKGTPAATLDSKDFYNLIDDARNAGVIQDRTQKAAHALRDTRNFVHPAVERRKGSLRDVDAKTAISLMNQVLEDVV